MSMDKSEIIKMVLELYSARKEAKEYLDFYAEPNEGQKLEEYKHIIREEFYPIRNREPKSCHLPDFCDHVQGFLRRIFFQDFLRVFVNDLDSDTVGCIMDSEDCLGIVRLFIDLVNCFLDLGILRDRLLCLTVVPVSVFAVFVSLFRVDLNGFLHEIVRSTEQMCFS